MPSTYTFRSHLPDRITCGRPNPRGDGRRAAPHERRPTRASCEICDCELRATAAKYRAPRAHKLILESLHAGRVDLVRMSISSDGLRCASAQAAHDCGSCSSAGAGAGRDRARRRSGGTGRRRCALPDPAITPPTTSRRRRRRAWVRRRRRGDRGGRCGHSRALEGTLCTRTRFTHALRRYQQL